MASVHKHIRSGTANKRPTTAIAEGQIALATNIASPGLFFKDSTGATIVKIGPVHVGATAPNVSPAGSAGNSIGEVWLDTSLTPIGVKIYNGSAFVNATPIGSTTVQGLLELATDAETQAGADTARAVTSASLQSKLSDSTSTTSNTTIASSTAVKAAYDLANAALPKTGGTVTGNLEIGTAGSLTFEGATADGFETTIAITDPTVDRTITLPNITGTVVTTGDTGTVTSTMILDGTIVDADINANAEISVSKLVDGSARQLLQTDAAGTGVEWASNIDIPGTLDVTSAATFDSTVTIAGDLTVNGTTTNINTVNLTVEDKNVIIGDVATPTDITADGGGITLKGTTDKTINWVDATDAWTLSEHVNIASAKEYRIAGTKVLDATSLGSAVVSSSLTSVGTIGTGVWQGTAITDTYLATIATAGKVSNSATTAASANTASAIVARDGSGNFTAGTITAALTGAASSNVLKAGDTMTGALVVPLASAATPSLTFTGDLDTGVFSPGANQVAVATNGVERVEFGTAEVVFNDGGENYDFRIEGDTVDSLFFVDASTDCVGIATSSPSGANLVIATNSQGGSGIKLIGKSANGGAEIDFRNNADSVLNGFIEFNNNGGILSTAINAPQIFRTNNNECARIRADGMFEVKGAGVSGSSPAFSVNGSAPANSAIIDSSGRLGIGTSSPNTQLNVYTLNPGGPLVTIGGANSVGGVTGIRMGYGEGSAYTKSAILFENTDASFAKGTLHFCLDSANDSGNAVLSDSKVAITSAGLVGIGTTSPNSSLVVSNSGANGIEFGPVNGDIFTYNRSTSAYTNTQITCNEFVVRTNGSNERARIDTSGRLLVGTSTARSNFYNSTNSPQLQIEGNDNSKAALAIIQDFNANAQGGQLVLAKNNSTTIGTNVLVVSGDTLGSVSFQGNDGTEFVEGASITAVVDGTPGANDMPGRLVFSTTADGASSPTERMKIANNGVFTHFSDGVYNFRTAQASSGSAAGIDLTHSSTGLGNGTLSLRMFTNGNVVNTNNSYGAISDIKLKENIVDASSQWDDLKALQVRKYNFKEETGHQTHTQLGLVAQEVELVSPGLVNESPDRDAEGNDLGTVTKGVNYSVLYMKAVKALQEAMERIETLEAKVAALETA